MSSPPAAVQPEIFPLTGVRAVAALWVVLFHMQTPFARAYPEIAPVFAPLVAQGYLGVDLFFILSGFIIYYNYAGRLAEWRPRAVAEFLWMRLARLWPVHVAVLLAFVLLLFVQRQMGQPPGTPELYHGGDFVRNLLLVHSWGVPLQVSWNVPAWSISCEWLAYLCFPLLLRTRLMTTSPRVSAAIALAGLFGTALVCQWLQDSGNASYGVVRIASEFTAGCGLCHVFRTGLTTSWRWEWIVPLTVLGVLWLPGWLFQGSGMVGYWNVPLLGLLVLGLAHHRGWVSRLLSTRVMLFGGYVSYSLYMVHDLVLIVLKRSDRFLGKAAPLVDLFLTIAAAVVMYRVVEEPCRKWMRQLFPRHRQQPYPVI